MPNEPAVELVFFAGCPLVEAARASIRAALSQAGLPLVWREWDQLHPEAPDRLRGFASPTVLVDGIDVMGGGVQSAGLSCSSTVASADAIAAALKR